MKGVKWESLGEIIGYVGLRRLFISTDFNYYTKYQEEEVF